jgi:RNA polymerase sigma factor (sigma-70 family)
MITRLELQQYRRANDRHRRSPENKAFRRRLDAAMAELQPVERHVVFLRYCCRLSWVAVGMRIHYSEAQTRRIDRKVRRKLEEAD